MNTDIDLDIIEAYASLKKQQQEIETKLKVMSNDIALLVIKTGKVTASEYTLSVGTKKLWKHSSLVELLEQQIKELKKQEIERGEAVLIKETVYPIVKFN
jgi:hypothetical protein